MSIFTKFFTGEKSALEKWGTGLVAVNSLKAESEAYTKDQIQAKIKDFRSRLEKQKEKSEIQAVLKKLRLKFLL